MLKKKAPPSMGGDGAAEAPNKNFIRGGSRRGSFVIKEDKVYEKDEDEVLEDRNNSSSRGGNRESLTMTDIFEDLEVPLDLNCEMKAPLNDNGDSSGGLDVSLLRSFARGMSMDSESGGSSSNSKDGSSETPLHDNHDISRRRQSYGESTASNFAGGTTRRKGDTARRMQARLGLHRRTTVDSVASHRRSSTGNVQFNPESSFGDSLASFTSLNSFTSSINDGDNNKHVAVGNLIFVNGEKKLSYYVALLILP